MIMKLCFFMLICFIYDSFVQATKEVVLLDTREARDYLNWDKTSNNGNLNDGWGELSFEAKLFPTLLLSPSTSTLWRTQYVCDITSERHVDNWLRSPYFKRQQAQRIEIELGFSIRDCSTFQTPNEIRSCRETFELYIHESDYEDNDLLWSSYKLVDVIAGNRFTSNNYGSQSSASSGNNLTVNVKTRGISVNKNGFYIAFRDQGACVSLLYVKIFYRLCQDTSIGLVLFPETPTGAHLTDIVERHGICTINSKPVQKPLGFCKGNGEWAFQETSLRDSCHCQDGYELLIDNKNNGLLSRAICKACSIGTFKSTISNNYRCERCPLNSHTKDKGASSCICNDGFFRLNASLSNSPCFGSPIEPQNVTVDDIDQASIKISWKRSIDNANDIVYRIECNRLVEGRLIPCESYISYQPNRTFINGSSVQMLGLDADTNYNIELYAEHLSTHLLSKSVDLSFTTKRPIPKLIRDINIRRISLNTIIISWSSNDFDQYQIRYWPLNDDNRKFLRTLLFNNFTLITQSDNYKFQLRGHTRFGWSLYTQEKSLSVSSLLVDEQYLANTKLTDVTTKFVENKTILLIGPFIILLLLITVIILAFIYSKKRRTCRLKTASDCESLDYQKRQGGYRPMMLRYSSNPTNQTITQLSGHYGPDAFFNSGWSAPLWPPIPTTSKTYIDPHTYEDPTKAVRDFARELDPNLIVIESVIGGGEFGDVCRGKLRKPNMMKDVPVAIKTLKQGAIEKTRLDFLSEASIMGQFDDENVIYLEGVVTKHHPIMIVTEYMENGSLDAYLRANEGNKCLDALQLTRMLRGIASGMKYLSDMKYVHRDLAARNILVNKDLICKVADFGLSREIDDGDSYTTKGGKIPIRWTAIEAIDYRKFTSASDVWSFGVLCWEVVSFGERPFWNWSNQDVIKAIKNSYRLPPPMGCPDVLYKLMLICWNEEYLERPKFTDIVQQLTQFIQVPSRLLSLAKQRFVFVNHPDQPNFAQVTSIIDWLHNLQLDRLIRLFMSAGYTNLSQICHFNQSDLHDIIGNSITLDEQTRLLDSLKHVRSQLVLISSKSLLPGEGYLV
ncbi:unnamed protein product [Rotaria socialis]|uniref:receptor protein-tyrosine kinase n=1 Tax=Rotaria socialis TaxID=392032 RepID=A0A821H0C0_9BILA|nr:unnamed protein product [Rotaria socialis]CAF4208220.1 unnamed protein product [Rotaria socialis]CAF4677744.1 unnamed protein product [Rotaria socialis]